MCTARMRNLGVGHHLDNPSRPERDDAHRADQSRADQSREQRADHRLHSPKARESQDGTRVPPSSSPPCTRAVACSSHIHATPRKHFALSSSPLLTYLLLTSQQPLYPRQSPSPIAKQSSAIADRRAAL
ncbi:hypothetical protein M430DRAFT_260618 [Amorphotheca resinae ATCC 22711]|uniref:Uncharacterized protein n=1 Tax=Amorphotheca resinae ATCC 22711 TaxID=857342 RepID=A0A2T3AZE2_AMORE|nr:hypothetical protein M430DRAFT_260618 [Amorphotheca resinae ATCC 22711]PSS15382.1 hypothetical protein M430DRAFT_260618 [Amorphotheca resinae ATCC 22711]